MFNSQEKFHLHTSLQISSCFSILHVHTGTANSRKAWKYLKKGMEVQEHIKKQLKLYKNTFCQLFHCKIQTFHCPNFKPLFPAILKIDFVLIL